MSAARRGAWVDQMSPQHEQPPPQPPPQQQQQRQARTTRTPQRTAEPISDLERADAAFVLYLFAYGYTVTHPRDGGKIKEVFPYDQTAAELLKDIDAGVGSSNAASRLSGASSITHRVRWRFFAVPNTTVPRRAVGV